MDARAVADRVVNGRFNSPDVFAPLLNGLPHSFGLFSTRWKRRCSSKGPFTTVVNGWLKLFDVFATLGKALRELSGPFHGVEKRAAECADLFHPQEEILDNSLAFATRLDNIAPGGNCRSNRRARWCTAKSVLPNPSRQERLDNANEIGETPT